MKMSVIAAAGLLASGLFAASAASAAPLGGIAAGGNTANSGLVQQIHGTHRVCERGPAGWHYHTRLTHRRIACRPASPGRLWIWRSEGGRHGWWHRHERRWHD